MNKLTKLLSIFLIAGAVGTGVAGVAGCKDNKPSGGGGGNDVHHTEQHKLNYENKNAEKHTITCDVDGCDYTATEGEHDWDATTNKCKLCKTDKPAEGGEKEYDIVTTSVNFKAAANEVAGAETTANQTVGTGGYTYGGKFFFADGNRFEPGSSCVNTQKKDVTITLGGETNSIKIEGKGASGTAGDIVLKNSSGTVIDTATSTGNGVAIALNGENLPAGVYTITSGTSVRLTEITITEKLEKSEATGITVTASKVDFLVKEDFSANGITVILNYANGRKDTLSATDYEVTQSIDKNTAGKYTVTVKYKENTAFTDTYDVYYYTIDSIEQSTIGIENNKQVMLQQAVVTGGTLSSKYLTVKGTGTVEGRTRSFNLPETALDIQLPAVTAEGEATVNYSVDTSCTTGGKALSGSYKVMVKNAISAVDNKVEVTVGATGDFKTLTQAVQFLGQCSLADDVNKVIKLQTGTYNEKVWIDMPNVTLMGLGENINDTKITYSLVEGDADLYSGALWALNCATVHVTGKNFKAYNLAIHNDFDYIANSGNYSGNQAAQGVALTLEGDGNVIYNCHLYGNQDTLYMKSGRTYYYKTQIDGNVDFIFGGKSGLAFFEECDIVAISRGKAENGHVAVPQHDEATEPDYGYIFYNCKFTDDGDVAEGGMTLGRPWGKKATVAYIECSFTAAYAQKFVDMSGNTPANANFYVYGSTDASGNPITGAPTGGKLLTAEQAANYTKANIFGANNGKSGYAAWDCGAAYTNLRILVGLEQGQITEDPVKTYDLLGFTGGNNGQLQSTTGDYEVNGITIKIDATNGKFAVRTQGDVQINSGTVIYVPMAADYEVSITDYQNNMLGATNYSIDYVDLQDVHYVKITFVANCYIKSITVNTEKTVTMCTVSFDLNGATGTAPAAQKVVIDGKLLSVTEPAWADHTFDGWYTAAEGGEKVDFSSYTVTADGVTLYAHWTEGAITEISTTTTITFGSSGDYKSYESRGLANYNGGVSRDNSGSDVQLKNNATFTIKSVPGATVSIVWYDDSKPQYGADSNADITVGEDGLITIVFTQGETDGASGLYIKSITITIAE